MSIVTRLPLLLRNREEDTVQSQADKETKTCKRYATISYLTLARNLPQPVTLQ